jgi:neutral amino acid transport system ATP-binding protein
MSLNTQSETEIIGVEGLSKYFMGIKALEGVSLSIKQGEIVGLIGPNGSGKTTLFNCITGFLKPNKGKIIYQGQEITGKKPEIIALKGLIRTFQIVRIFPCLSVKDNLIVALQQHQEDNIIKRIFWSKQVKGYEKEASHRADELLDFTGLSSMSDQPASSLSYGQRKILEFAASLMPNPKVILLDEPTAAVNPVMINQFKEYLLNANDQGITIFLIEHNMDVVMDLCHRIIVLDNGIKIAEGKPREIQTDSEVIEAYFGHG